MSEQENKMPAGVVSIRPGVRFSFIVCKLEQATSEGSYMAVYRHISLGEIRKYGSTRDEAIEKMVERLRHNVFCDVTELETVEVVL